MPVLGVLVLGEVFGWQLLRLYVAPISATLILVAGSGWLSLKT
jgi:hypothetical protein